MVGGARYWDLAGGAAGYEVGVFQPAEGFPWVESG